LDPLEFPGETALELEGDVRSKNLTGC